MTAYDIIAQLKLTPGDYHRALVFNPRYINPPEMVTLEVRPLQFVQRSEAFRVPAEGAKALAAELNAIFESARKLTA